MTPLPPPPIEFFRKIIRFGSVTRPLTAVTAVNALFGSVMPLAMFTVLSLSLKVGQNDSDLIFFICDRSSIITPELWGAVGRGLGWQEVGWIQKKRLQFSMFIKKNKEDTLNKMSFVFKQEKKGKKGWTHNKVIKTRPQSCAGHHHQFLPSDKILSFLGILLFPKYSFEKVTNRTRLQQNF